MKTLPKPWRNERGSTLILVILLGLVLSASAIVALRDVARSARASGVFRTRTQAQLTSDSADRLFADYVGNNFESVEQAIQNSLSGETTSGLVNIVGASGAGDPTQQSRVDLLTQGGQREYSYLDLQNESVLPSGGTETGLFQLGPAEQTFETRRKTKFRVKIRDLTDGFTAPGYSAGTCFKKAVLASEAIVGTVDPNWNKANNVAQARHMVDAMIGPIECGYN